jgi:hypothetical protein
VFTGDEGDKQSVKYHYKCNAEECLILGDGFDL